MVVGSSKGELHKRSFKMARYPGTNHHMIDKVFGGHKDPLRNIGIYAGVPTHNADHIGEFCYDSASNDYYIATDVVGTWVKINA